MTDALGQGRTLNYDFIDGQGQGLGQGLVQGLGQGLGQGLAQAPGQGLDPGRMEIASEVLRIAISTASQPTLRRLIVSTPLGDNTSSGVNNSSGINNGGVNNGGGGGGGGGYGSDSDVVLLRALAGVLQMLPVARRAVTDRPNTGEL